MDQAAKPVLSFGRCAQGTSTVYYPTSINDVREVFALGGGDTGRRIAIRGGGHSFDSQAVHDADAGTHIVLSACDFEPHRIEFDPGGRTDTVTLGAGVTWGRFIDAALERAQRLGEPVRMPGTLQTSGGATVGGTLAGNTLSRFSGTVGKESRWIESFRILTPAGGHHDVSEQSDQDLFYAVIGGHGYIGFVTDATYRLTRIPSGSCAHTRITRLNSFKTLIREQLRLIDEHEKSGSREPLAVSSAWYKGLRLKGGMFESRYLAPSTPPLPGFPLYDDTASELRYFIEVMARNPIFNLAIHEALYQMADDHGGRFENALRSFLFFMDGNTFAKKRFEERHPGELFPIVQQTYVIPTARAEAFARLCQDKIDAKRLHPTECDMLFVQADEALMSANYQLPGFAITVGFEPIAKDGCPPNKITALLRALSKDCLEAGGRIHLVKNLYADPADVRAMFSPQIETFEQIKRQHDPNLILQNSFSDKLFEFSPRPIRLVRGLRGRRRPRAK